MKNLFLDTFSSFFKLRSNDTYKQWFLINCPPASKEITFLLAMDPSKDLPEIQIYVQSLDAFNFLSNIFKQNDLPANDQGPIKIGPGNPAGHSFYFSGGNAAIALYTMHKNKLLENPAGNLIDPEKKLSSQQIDECLVSFFLNAESYLDKTIYEQKRFVSKMEQLISEMPNEEKNYIGVLQNEKGKLAKMENEFESFMALRDKIKLDASEEKNDGKKNEVFQL